MKLRILTPGFVLFHVLALHAAGAYFIWSPSSSEEGELAGEVEHALAVEGQRASTRAPVVMPALHVFADDDIEIAAEAQSEERAATPQAPAQLPGHLDLTTIEDEDGVLTSDVGSGWTAELTLEPALQKLSERALKVGRVPFGAVVLLDPRTGDVLAMADRLQEDHPAVPDLSPDGPSHVALRAVAPAASVFKVITSSALLDAGMRSNKRMCFTPARRRITGQHLKAPKHDGACGNMGEALAHSENGWFARASHKLFKDARPLRDMASRFGFNRVLPFEALTDASVAQVPDNPLERARMSAGFWHTRLTPLHGALIAASVAEGGLMPTPRMVSRLRDPMGNVVEAPAPKALGRPLDPRQARAVGKMMTRTVSSGTATKAFSKKSLKHLRGISVAGKTGTLHERTDDRFTAYTWFIGYAPADNPQVAVAVMVGNGEKWWWKAVHVARYVLNGYFKLHPDAEPPTVAFSHSRRG